MSNYRQGEIFLKKEKRVEHKNYSWETFGKRSCFLEFSGPLRVLTVNLKALKFRKALWFVFECFWKRMILLSQ